MKKLLLILSCCFIFSCGNSDSVEISKEECTKLKSGQVYIVDVGEIRDTEFKVVIIDSCEYLYAWERSASTIFAHKGNCKFYREKEIKTEEKWTTNK